MEFVYIATAHFLALLIPGPDFFLIVQASLRLPRRAGLALCTGIAAANGLYLLLAVAGLEILRQVPWLMVTLRYLGGTYLLLLGMQLLRAPRAEVGQDRGTRVVDDNRPWRQFVVGLLAALLNPKNAIFYLSLFTVMVSAETALFQRCLYGLWMTAVVLLWDGAIVLFLGEPRVRRRLQGAVFVITKGAGAMLAIAGLTLPFG
jgi:threonine/homoserine/homoserine lactone efflux protein